MRRSASRPVSVKNQRPNTKNRDRRGGIFWRLGQWVWCGSIWHKLAVVVLAFMVLVVGGLYGVARWYIGKHANEPLRLGTTFVANYAEGFGLDPETTLDAILGDMGMKRVRLVSYWKDIEATPGVYDFSKLDRQFEIAARHNAKVSLAIGLRQPRWPECHEPKWVQALPKSQWQPLLFNFIAAVVERYKTNPILQDYQLENEFFMTVFGECKDFDRQRLIDELTLVKRHDPSHPIVISRSNNWVGLPLGRPRPDQFAISVYKRVWDAMVTKRYFEYPLPAWFYASLAGGAELLTGKSMVIHELQAEPWPPNGQLVVNTSLEEQYKSMNARRMKDRIAYARSTGMRTIDLWGAEWWYWLKVKKNSPDVWNIVKEAVDDSQIKNRQLSSR